jgi:hypothetical protein
LPLGLLLLGGGESMMLEVSWCRGMIERRYNNDHFDRRMPIFFSWDTVIAVIGDIGGNNKCSGRNSVRDGASEGKGRGGDGKLFEKAYIANKSTIPTAATHPTDQRRTRWVHSTTPDGRLHLSREADVPMIRIFNIKIQRHPACRAPEQQ